LCSIGRRVNRSRVRSAKSAASRVTVTFTTPIVLTWTGTSSGQAIAPATPLTTGQFGAPPTETRGCARKQLPRQGPRQFCLLRRTPRRDPGGAVRWRMCRRRPESRERMRLSSRRASWPGTRSIRTIPADITRREYSARRSASNRPIGAISVTS
jgi:hypothetical protein